MDVTSEFSLNEIDHGKDSEIEEYVEYVMKKKSKSKKTVLPKLEDQNSPSEHTHEEEEDSNLRQSGASNLLNTLGYFQPIMSPKSKKNSQSSFHPDMENISMNNPNLYLFANYQVSWNQESTT